MLHSTPEWSKSFPVLPRNHLKSHVFIDEKLKFRPSYENEDCRHIPMNLLLGWEYARKWLKERNEFCKVREQRLKPKHIKNDYQAWLEKRKPKQKFSCKPEGINKLMSTGGKNRE